MAGISTRLLRAGRAPGWGLLDQGLYSGTNVVAVIVVARVLGPEAFGAFALVLAVWAMIWVLGRAVFAEPFVIRASALSLEEWRTEAAHAAGTLLAAGAAAGAAVALVALVLDGTLGATFLALALFVPVLLLQDFWRIAAFSREQGGLAVVNDAVWAVVQFATFGALWALDAFTAPAALAAWALGGLAGGLVGQVQFRLRPALTRETARWAREAFRLGGWFGSVQGIQSGGTQIVFVVVGALTGLSAVGGLRAAYTLFGPLGALYRAMQLPALPAMSRAVPGSLLWFVLLYAGALTLIAAIYGGFLVAGGGVLLGFVYGAAFAEFAPLLLPVALAFVGMAMSNSLGVALRAQRVGRGLLAIEIVNTGLRLTFAPAFLMVFGLVGVAWAFALVSAINVMLLWRTFDRNRAVTSTSIAYQSDDVTLR